MCLCLCNTCYSSSSSSVRGVEGVGAAMQPRVIQQRVLVQAAVAGGSHQAAPQLDATITMQVGCE